MLPMLSTSNDGLINCVMFYVVLAIFHPYNSSSSNTNIPFKALYRDENEKLKSNKRPMGHIAYLRKQFKSIITYDYIMKLIKRRKKYIVNFMRMYWFFMNFLNPLHPRMLYAKFGWNWPSGSGEEAEIVKSLRQQWRQQQRRQRWTTDKFRSEKLTWALGSGELKSHWYAFYIGKKKSMVFC